MEKIKNFLQEHKIAIALAVLTSVIIAFPQVYFRIDNKELYQDGVEAIEMLPDSPWSARVREVQDGHINWGSIYFKDGKDDPYLYQPLGSIVVAYTGELFGFGINNTLLLAKIVYSFLTFLLIYFFVFSVSRHRWAALTSTSVVLLAEPILSPVGLKSFLTGALFNRNNAVNFLELSAPVISSMILIFLFGFLIACWQYYQKRDWRWGLLSALLLGLNVYNYFYSATYLFAFCGVLILLFLLQKKWQEARRIFCVLLGGLAVALPFIWNLYNASQYPAYEEVARRVALVSSHAPQFIGIVAFTGLVVFFLGFPREDKQKYLFGLSLLLTPFVTLNQQILTGKVLQAGHYHWYMHKPIAVIFATVTFFYLLDKWKLPNLYKKFIAGFAIAVSVVVGVNTQMLAYSIDREGVSGERFEIEMQKYAPVMHWLNVHAEKESVVFANETTSWVTGIYTPLNVFYVQIAHNSLVATDARIRELLFTHYRLRGVDNEHVREIFYQERGLISKQLYGLYYREKGPGGRDEDIPDEIIESMIADYEKTLSSPTQEWLYNVWSKYEVEHLVWDKKADPDWNLDQYLFLTKEATFGDFTIYSFPGMKTM